MTRSGADYAVFEQVAEFLENRVLFPTRRRRSDGIRLLAENQFARLGRFFLGPALEPRFSQFRHRAHSLWRFQGVEMVHRDKRRRDALFADLRRPLAAEAD